jgi:predicted Zn-dependent protease
LKDDLKSILNYTVVLFIAIYFSACDNEDKTISHDNLQNTPNLTQIDFEYWDQPSKESLQKHLNIEHDKLSYTQNKHISEILIEHGESDFAIAILEQMNISQSQYLTYLLASTFYKQGELEKALASIEKNSWNKVNSALLNLKYKILLETGQTNQLINLLESKNQQDILKATLAKYYLAMAFLQNKQCNKAIVFFNQVISENPYANKIYGPLASAYQQCNEPNKSITARHKQGKVALSDTLEFQQRLLKNGNPVGFYNQLLKSALKYNNTSKIISTAESLIKLGEKNVDLLQNYAIALYRSNQLDSANSALNEAVILDTKNVKSYQLQFEFNRQKNPEIAKKAINQLINIDPNNALYQKAKDYLYKKQS